MTEAISWLRQVASDYTASVSVYDSRDPGTYCQVIAKYQQVVEKSIKALVAALNEEGLITLSTGKSHDPEKLVKALVQLPHRQGKNKDLYQQIIIALNDHRRGEIRAISAFAPKMPEPGQLRTKNTEYPYHNPDGTWRTPADLDSFTQGEVIRFQKLAQDLYEQIPRIVSAIRRGT